MYCQPTALRNRQSLAQGSIFLIPKEEGPFGLAEIFCEAAASGIDNGVALYLSHHRSIVEEDRPQRGGKQLLPVG